MHDLLLLKTVALGFAAAWVLGMITQRLGLSPIVGYLLAGVVIGPHTPGFVGDQASASQLAEIGVILLMFGVGLHFNVKDLAAVRGIAIPGAVGQSLMATAAGAGVCAALGWPLSAGLVLGVAMSVASTVVLVRVLTDAGKLDTPAGHAAVGWLIVEDIITVVALVMIPALAGGVVAHEVVNGAVHGAHETLSTVQGAAPDAAGALPAPVHEAAHAAQGAAGHAADSADRPHWAMSLLIAMVKLAVMVAVVVVGGSKVVPVLLVWVAKMRSRELFTLTVLVLSVAVAVGALYLFGASVALGAFLAGMVVAQSPVSQQAGADVLPLRDAFAVLFFVSVGMLFDPAFVIERPLLMAAGLAIVLLVKPVAAVLIVAVLGYPARTALTVAIALAQIGEFSFIVADLGFSLGILPDDGRSLLVACAIVSITLNPLLFRTLDPLERWLQKRPRLWNLLDRRAAKRTDELNADFIAQRKRDDAQADAQEEPQSQAAAPSDAPDQPAQPTPSPRPGLAIVVGYGPAGREVDRLLREAGLRTRIVDLNVDTIKRIRAEGREAVYGDATQAAILEDAGIERASHLVLTMPDSARRIEVIAAATALSPGIKVLARARFAADLSSLAEFPGARAAVDEIEAAAELARLVLVDLGADPDRIEHEVGRVRGAFSAAARGQSPP